MAGWIIAVGAAAGVALSAWRLGVLSGPGAIAATAVGAVVLSAAGFGLALILVVFFVSSSLLSALPGGGGRSRRGARQVMANGSVPGLAALFIGGHPLAGLAFLGALAAATADTWATEVGLRLARRPRSILSWRTRTPGSSGAVSIPGTLGAAAGALAVALAGGWWSGGGVEGATISAVAIAGFLGSVADSLLGDGLQAVYHCPGCGVSPEVARHAGCATRALRVRGVAGLDNDVVNWVTTAMGAAIAVTTYRALTP